MFIIRASSRACLINFSIAVETTSRLTEAEKELSHLKQKCSDSELIKSNVSFPLGVYNHRCKKFRDTSGFGSSIFLGCFFLFSSFRIRLLHVCIVA